MKSDSRLPRVLVIDDQFGRKAREPNEDRVNFCRSYRLVDVTPEDRDAAGPQFRDPIAEAVFCRGQNPVAATPGDVVVNDLDGLRCSPEVTQ